MELSEPGTTWQERFEMDYEKEQEKKNVNVAPGKGGRESLFSVTNIPVEENLSFFEKLDYWFRKDMFVGTQLWKEELDRRYGTSNEQLREKYLERASQVNNSEEAFKLYEELEEEIFNASAVKNPKPEPNSKFWKGVKKLTDVLCGADRKDESEFLEFLKETPNVFRNNVRYRANRVDLNLKKYIFGMSLKKFRKDINANAEQAKYKYVQSYVGGARYIPGLLSVILLSVIYFNGNSGEPMYSLKMMFMSMFLLIYSIVLGRVFTIMMGYLKYVSNKKTQKDDGSTFLGIEITENKKIIGKLLSEGDIENKRD